MEIEMYEQLPEDAKRIRMKVFMEEQGFENEFDDIDNLSIHFLIFEKAIPLLSLFRFLRNDKLCGNINKTTSSLLQYSQLLSPLFP